MEPPKPVEYAMVVVKLDHPETDRKKAFEEIKSIFGIADPVIDDKYGAIPDSGRPGRFVVLIEENFANRLKGERNPNLIGVYKNTKLDPFLTHGGCIPPGTRGGPRRNPKI